MVDTQHKLESVRQLQTHLVPLVGEVNTLKKEIATANERIQSIKYDETTITEQEKRFAELVSASRVVATDVAERGRQMQALSEALARSTTLKDELLAELDGVQSRQRDTVGQIQASEDQLARAEKMFKLLEQRRAQVAFGEKKLAAVETRLTEIKQLSEELEQNLHSVANREQLVKAVKAEVDTVHQISARSKADLAHVTEHRNEIAALKAQVDLLLARIGETDERIQAIDARRKLVDEVQAKANAIVHLLDDVRVNLEMLGEQKAVVDHVAEKAAQLEFMLQETRNTTRALQHERELAERIERSIKALRSKPAPASEARTA
jgi:chromosome segregation ATPase